MGPRRARLTKKPRTGAAAGRPSECRGRAKELGVWIIASLTLREALRRKALVGAGALTALYLVLFGIGSYYAVADINATIRSTSQQKLFVTGEVLLAGCYGAANIGALLALFVAASAITQEIEQGTLQAIVPRPLRRWQVIVGKWLGFAAMLFAYVTVSGLIVNLTMWALSGYLSAQLLPGLVLMALKAVLLLSLGLALSSLMPALTTGITGFILYAAAGVAGMVEQLGRIVRNQTMIDIGILTSLVIPSDAIWKMAAFEIQPPRANDFLAAANISGPFSVVVPPSVWMGVYAVAYTAVMLVVACVVFSRRDL
jgi:Cu-processing system permease protein